MRHFEIDRQTISTTTLPPSGRSRANTDRAAQPSHLASSLRLVLLACGRCLDGVAILVTGILLPPLIVGTALPLLVPVAVALVAANLLGSAEEHGLRRAVAAAGTCLAVVLAGHWLALRLLGVAPSLSSGLAWGAGAGLSALALRLAWGRVVTRAARWRAASRRVLIVGDRDRAFEVLALLAESGRRWAFPVAICLDRDPPPHPVMGGFLAGLGDVDTLVHDLAVDDVVVALPWSDRERLGQCMARLRPLSVDIHLFPEIIRPYADSHALSLLAGMPMAKLHVRPLAGGRALMKAGMDYALAGCLVVALAPLLAVIALAIKLDSPGPVLFRQPRYGFDNRPFTCFKFRSMHHRPPEAETRQATRDDPRITRVGRVLRRSSLDELPQLFNVLNGTMSLVGPRPHAVSHHHAYARLVDDYRCRHRMKPGLTGWAQIHGFRGETSTVDMMRERVAHDLWYIDHWSPWLDLSILAKTPGACLKGTNAY